MDPFCGTGSIALACQYFGTFQFGSDLDMRVLKGHGVGHKTTNKGIEGLDKIEHYDINTNFKYYGLPLPDFMGMDVANLNMKMKPMFDAIICDPPYGVRAMTKKTGIKEAKLEKGLKPKKESAEQ